MQIVTAALACRGLKVGVSKMVMRSVWPRSSIEGSFISNVSSPCSNKKQPLWFLVITYAVLDQFAKFFHWQIPKRTPCAFYRSVRLTFTRLVHYFVKVEADVAISSVCLLHRGSTSNETWSHRYRRSARWPLESNLNVRWAQVLHTEI